MYKWRLWNVRGVTLPLLLRHCIYWYEEEWSTKFRIYNGSWLETLNLIHTSSCEKLHLAMSYLKQNRKRTQTWESAQYGLEIIFNANCTKRCICLSSFLSACMTSGRKKVTSPDDVALRCSLTTFTLRMRETLGSILTYQIYYLI